MNSQLSTKAVSHGERRGWAVVSLLELYAQDEEFGGELEELYKHKHGDTTKFLRRWGLDRIEGDLGKLALESWLIMKENASSSGSITTQSFGAGIGFGAAVPEPKKIHIVFSRYVDLTQESPIHARDRLVDEFTEILKSELERIATQYEQEGYMLADTKHEFERHIRWVFLRLAFRRPKWTIANDEFISESAVDKATGQLGDLIGITKYPNARSRRA